MASGSCACVAQQEVRPWQLPKVTETFTPVAVSMAVRQANDCFPGHACDLHGHHISMHLHVVALHSQCVVQHHHLWLILDQFVLRDEAVCNVQVAVEEA